MRFQVILPTCNASRWFHAALASVAGHPQGEVLVIDDGSRDEEREKVASICRQFNGVRFFPEPHRGLVGTLNFGLSLASAHYIARMDADDISLPGRFDKQLAFLDANREIALVGGQMKGIDSAGKFNGKSTQFPTAPATISAYLKKGKNPFMHPSVMMRRSVVEEIGGYRPATEYAEDYDLWLRLVEKYPLANFAQPLIYYRRHETQITRSTNWEQKFARDLATLSAQRRRAGKIDPLIQLDTTDEDILALGIAYHALSAKECVQHVCDDLISFILSSIDRDLIGSSSKPQAQAAAHAAKWAWKNSNLKLGAYAAAKGLKRNPMMFLKSLVLTW